MEFVRQVLPYTLIAFYLLKGIKHPIYFLGIPFLIFMNESIFFQNVNIFDNPGSLGTARIFFWTVIFWAIPIFVRLYTGEYKRQIRFELNVLDYCIFALIALSLLGLISVFADYSGLDGVFVEFLTIISLFVGYFIIKYWSSLYDTQIIKEFIYTLVVINSVAALFYILHQGLGLDIYQSEEYSAEYFQGEEVTRTFWFMPQFLFLSVAFLLVFKKKDSGISIILLLINILAIFITYTRSALINAVLIFIIYSIFMGLKKNRIGLVLRDITLYLIAGIAGLFILSQVLPAKSDYLINRFKELSESSSSPTEMNTLEYRFMMTGMVFSKIEPDNLIIGMGPVTENQEILVPTMKLTTSDMVWAGVTYRWGFLGLVIFIFLYGLSAIQAYKIFMSKGKSAMTDLALVLLLFIISQMIESFVSWTFMSGHGYVIGLWYFAILSTMIEKNKRNSKPLMTDFNNAKL